MNWTFDNPRRLALVAAGAVVAGLVLFVVLLGLRVHRMADALAQPEPEVVPTALVPPTPTVLPAPASPTAPGSDPVALEAVNAFLLHDLTHFSTLASPEVAEQVIEAPPAQAGAVVTGPAVVVHGGPTEQIVQVPTSLGDLDLTLAWTDGAWIVTSMEYHR
jgi:hypothetical protein